MSGYKNHHEVCVGALVEVVEHGELDGLRGEVTQLGASAVHVELKQPYGEMRLELPQVRVIGERYGSWEKVMSSSTSPGDFYWYNWETGDSTWDAPDEVKELMNSPLQPQYYAQFQPQTYHHHHAAHTSHNPHAPSPSFSTSTSSSRKRDFSATEEREASPHSSSSEAIPTPTPACQKEVELTQLKHRLMALERKKRRIEAQRSSKHPAADAPAAPAAARIPQMPEVKRTFEPRTPAGGAPPSDMMQIRSALDKKLELVNDSPAPRNSLVVISDNLVPEAD